MYLTRASGFRNQEYCYSRGRDVSARTGLLPAFGLLISSYGD